MSQILTSSPTPGHETSSQESLNEGSDVQKNKCFLMNGCQDNY